MENDDEPVGRVLSRREAVKLLALTGSVGLMGARWPRALSSETRAPEVALPGCIVRPELTEGPYFVDHQLNRSDIRGEAGGAAIKAGVPLALVFNIAQVTNRQCAPLAGAIVDVWHCDAAGTYSGVNDGMVGFNTVGKQYLRGFQTTDANGVARFSTIYPGWYQGRAVHIHFKIRTAVPAAVAGGATRSYEFTSQFFFDDALSDRILANAPYAAKGKRDLRNADDGIFRESRGQLLLAAAPSGNGYASSFDLGLDLSDEKVGAPDGGGGRGGPGGPPPFGRGRGRGGPPPRGP